MNISLAPQSIALHQYSWLDTINSSKYLFAMAMLIMNICSRYVELDISKKHKQYMATSKIINRLLIFTMAFIATRDVVVSLVITASFIIFVLHLFNQESEYCLWRDEIDTNKDGRISADEIKIAYERLKQEGKI